VPHIEAQLDRDVLRVSRGDPGLDVGHGRGSRRVARLDEEALEANLASDAGEPRQPGTSSSHSILLRAGSAQSGTLKAPTWPPRALRLDERQLDRPLVPVSVAFALMRLSSRFDE
jgi:hypothetical protein